MTFTNKKRVNSATEATVPYSCQKESMRNIITCVFVLIIIRSTLQGVHYESAEGVLMERPKHVTVIVNRSTFFNCSKSNNNQNEPIWYHHTLMGVRQDVYDNQRIRDRYKDRFSIDKNLNSGTFNLLVQRPERIDAGRYECVEDVEADTGPSAELTILDSNLICESDKDFNEIVGPTQCDKPIARDQLQLSCSVAYSGNFPPQMQWRKVGNELQLNETKCDFRGNRVMCNATLEANLNMDGSVYICHIITAEQYNCSLKVNKIIYAFSGTSVKAITAAEEAFCSANTSMGLPCSYTWYNADKKTEQLDRTLKPNNHGLYRCEAECKIRKETCSFTAMIIYAAETNTKWIITAILVTFFVVSAVYAAIVIVVVLRPRIRRNEYNGWKCVKKPKAENANKVPLVKKISSGKANKVWKTSAEDAKEVPLVGKTSAGSTEKAEATAADSNLDDYTNMTTDANDTINGSQATTYMELTSSDQAPPSVYASIDIAGKIITMPRTPSPAYGDMADL